MSIKFVRRLAPAVLFAATVAIASPGVSSAEGTWDIEAFDTCTEMLNDGLDESQQEKLEDTKGCCTYSGGVWNDAEKKCVAPPAESEGAALPGLPKPLTPIAEPQVAPPPLSTVQPPLAGRHHAIDKASRFAIWA
ncbi:hypothetical protein [Mycobacterium hubeiense]|uniref:hypothetical protein n=1 Tax=Mycobacterium hubeiense TaxID=1867256 RepID=UPI000C7F0846|nr:hypothetical protein [Mycobacterium sp. QGD 101]